MRRLLIAGTAAVCAAAVLAFGGTGHRTATRGVVLDARVLGLLGLEFQERARATGDPTWYAKSAVLARDRFARRRFDGVLLRPLPAVSAAVIFAVGIAMTVRALPRVG